MIKFNCLIHKETSTVIKYEDWKEKLDNNEYIIINNYTHGPMTMILNDDFEIIYDSEFTTEELIQLYGLSGELSTKMANIIHERRRVERYLKDRYRFEV